MARNDTLYSLNHIFTAVLGLVCAVLSYLYQFQNSKLWDEAQLISKLEAQLNQHMINDEKFETEIRRIANIQSEVRSEVAGLKQADQTFLALHKDLEAKFDSGRSERLKALEELDRKVDSLEARCPKNSPG
jgi:chromosome segregation ATPase